MAPQTKTEKPKSAARQNRATPSFSADLTIESFTMIADALRENAESQFLREPGSEPRKPGLY